MLLAVRADARMAAQRHSSPEPNALRELLTDRHVEERPIPERHRLHFAENDKVEKKLRQSLAKKRAQTF
jgi:hypothetical protein